MQKDQYFCKIAHLSSKLNHIIKLNLVLNPISDPFRAVINDFSLNDEFRQLDGYLDTLLSKKSSIIEISTNRNSKTFKSLVKSAKYNISLIRNLIEKISKYQMLDPNLNEIKQKSLNMWNDYKIIGRCINEKGNDPTLLTIQRYIDGISYPLLNLFNEQEVESNDDFSGMFIALVGPSLTGKSQSAFTLAFDQAVLYFNFRRGSQFVYKPFAVISDEMKDCLAYDLKQLKQNTEILDFPGAQLLSDNGKLPLKSLEFLFSLAEEGLDFSYDTEFWLDHYIKLKVLITRGMSIKDFKSKFSKSS